MSTDAPLTANSTIGTWLDDPRGYRALEGILSAAGVEPDRLAPVRSMPLAQLVDLSQGALTRETVDELVRSVNGGEIPEEDPGSVWRERVAPGRFEGRTVVVTGAASGIGRATASRIAREGGRVVAVDLAAEGLEQLAGGLPEADIVPVTADLTRPESIDGVLEAAGPRIDALANVAGIVDDFSPLHEVSDEAWAKIFAINVDALFRLSRAVIPLMLEAGRGSIVNVASEAALKASTSGTAYTATKHAVVGITQSSAFMYGPQGLRVNAVAPGPVATGISGGMNMSEFGRERTGGFLQLMPPVSTPEQLAASITFLLSDDGVNVNGAVLPSDGGWAVQ